VNIFYLSTDPVEAAKMQCDKHVVKMIVETAQLLSTAHRLLDGTMEIRRHPNSGRRYKYWVHPQHIMELKLYKATHVNHPSAIWTREAFDNYHWLYAHFIALLDEYTYRYDKTHGSSFLKEYLIHAPHNIINERETMIPLCMKSQPQCINENDRVQSYRDFYKTKQYNFKMNWTRRSIPTWFNDEDISNRL